MDPTVIPSVPANPPAQIPLSGFKSSEFVATILAMVALTVPGIPDKYMPFIIGIAGVYTACRSLLKAIHTLGYAKAVPDLPAIPPLPAGSTTITTVPALPTNLTTLGVK